MTDALNPAVLRATACSLARLGGQTAARYFGKVSVTRKPDRTPVTEADHAAQAAILADLAQRHPDHAVIVEEEIADPARHAAVTDADYTWVVDPIDGTRNFARGLAVYSTSVAVMRDGSPIAGAILDATTGAVYSAHRDGGAFRDDHALVLRDRPIDADTNIALSSYRNRPLPAPVRQWLDTYLFRSIGSLCLHLVWVAAGLADAAHAVECKLWDVAAGSLIIQEAGGVITNHDGRPLWPNDLASYRDASMPILAGTPTMHATLLPELQSASRRNGSG